MSIKKENKIQKVMPLPNNEKEDKENSNYINVDFSKEESKLRKVNPNIKSHLKKDRAKKPKKEKVDYEKMSVKEIEAHEKKLDAKHNAWVTLLQFVILLALATGIIVQIYFINWLLSILIGGIFIMVISIFIKIASPFRNSLEKINRSAFWVLFAIGFAMTLMSGIFIATH